MGRIANLASNVGFKSTTLAREMQHFVNIIIFMSITMAIVFFIIAMALGYPWLTAISFLIGIICANVPEGLLSTICVSKSKICSYAVTFACKKKKTTGYKQKSHML
jgi:sodium/potassium-transporting ATPase subunit alpha